MKQPRIVISVNSNLETDQRVHKVAQTLYENGYDVLVVGQKRGSKIADYKKDYKTNRFRLFFYRKVFFFIDFNIRLFFYLLFTKADIFLSNDTDTILPNYFVSKIRKKKLVFDAHEMYPEVPELAHRPRTKKIWERIENYTFPKLKNAYTVCQPIADIYNERYNISMKVVRNIPFAKKEVEETKDLKQEGKKILLYQGAINTGRGLEWIIDTMPLLDDCIFYIAGDGYQLPQIKQYAKERNLDNKVIFLGAIPFQDLHSYTVNADLGISLLANQGLNYYYSLPNRIFDFIRAQVPVLATGFPEIKNIVENYHIGRCIDHYEPNYLAGVIKEMLSEEKDTEGFAKANKELTWENETKVLLDIFNNLK
ncbi:glycosyltransferase [Bacteroidales bacterium OttesenSCG-928-C19]|nr:glycosyltransferase [Bacteroidales bacterium OttesenSCG-928-C19]